MICNLPEHGKAQPNHHDPMGLPLDYMVECKVSDCIQLDLRVSARSMDPSGESLSTSSKVSSARMDQAAFSSESGVPTPKGMTAPAGVATRKSQLWCTVLTFPASSFTSCAGMPPATWQTTTYSVSLHWSLTFHFPWYMSFFISTTSPGTNCVVLMVLS